MILDSRVAYRIPDPTRRPRSSGVCIVSAVFHDPDAAGRAYDSVIELGFANEAVTASAIGAAATQHRAGGRRTGVVLAVEPRTEEEARSIAEGWRACGAPEVIYHH